MQRFLKRVFVYALVVDILGLLLVIVAERKAPATLVEVRRILYTSYESDLRFFELDPKTLAEKGFLLDPPELVAQWRERLEQVPAYRELFEKLSETTSTIEKAKLIAQSFSRGGGYGSYDHSADLLLKLTTISSAQGKCSDHAEVFDALAAIAGISTIETIVGIHVTSQFYAAEINQWVWLDPQYCLLAKDSAGKYLSALQLRHAYQQQLPVEFEYFGPPVADTIAAVRDEMYVRDNLLSQFDATWGNNVFTQDKYRRVLIFLPKAIRQVPWHVIGVKPDSIALDDGSGTVRWRIATKLGLNVIAWILLLGTFSYPALLLSQFIRKSIRGFQPKRQLSTETSFDSFASDTSLPEPSVSDV